MIDIIGRLKSILADIATAITDIAAVETKVDTAITDIAAAEAKVDTAIADIGTVDTVVDAIKTETDKTSVIRYYIPARFGGIEDETLLKNGADPAAFDVATKYTPTLPAGATPTDCKLLFKFRELYCAAANFVSTAGVIQVKKAGGAFITGITIPTGTFDVAAGVAGAGDLIVGNVDISAQIESGIELEFQWITIRSNVDNLAVRDIEIGVSIGYTM